MIKFLPRSDYKELVTEKTFSRGRIGLLKLSRSYVMKGAPGMQLKQVRMIKPARPPRGDGMARYNRGTLLLSREMLFFSD